MSSRLWLLIWIALAVAVVVPWGSLDAHPHWSRVQWIPFFPPTDLRDVVGNVLFYVPFGVLASANSAGRRTPTLVVAICAAVLSTATEVTQVFSADRFPSITDVTCNLVGAVIGAKWIQISPHTDTRH